MGDQCLIKKKKKKQLEPYKTEVAKFFTDATDFDNEKIYLCILTQATIKCAFLRDKNVILLIILSGTQNLFLDLKQQAH